ncbi:MAG: carbon storage regulator [Gracilibacteraceae bacterium]|jgi:carbon storage regulator|nr:carbon storage regulator [Gracilibacteraceae bacterium]
MLVLTRKIGQKIIIGDDIEVMLAAVGGGMAHISVYAPADIPVVRQDEAAADRVLERHADVPMVITRKVSEQILVGSNIQIMLVSIIGDTVRLGIEAPRDIKIMRQEVLEEVRDQNLKAVQNQGAPEELKDLLPKKESTSKKE